MSSRFISGGAIDPSSGERIEAAPADNERPVGKNTAEWEAVQKEVEEQRKRREEVRRQEEAGEQKSLYDILQANKGTSFFSPSLFSLLLAFFFLFSERGWMGFILTGETL